MLVSSSSIEWSSDLYLILSWNYWWTFFKVPMQWDIVQLFQIHELLKFGKIKKSIMNFKSHSGLVRFKSGNFFFLTILVNISLIQRMTKWLHSKVFFRDRLCQPINQLLYTNILHNSDINNFTILTYWGPGPNPSLWDKVIVLWEINIDPASPQQPAYKVSLWHCCVLSVSQGNLAVKHKTRIIFS